MVMDYKLVIPSEGPVVSSDVVLDDPIPTEEITLKFEEIKTSYTEYDDTGSSMGVVEYIYNLITGNFGP